MTYLQETMWGEKDTVTIEHWFNNPLLSRYAIIDVSCWLLSCIYSFLSNPKVENKSKYTTFTLYIFSLRHELHVWCNNTFCWRVFLNSENVWIKTRTHFQLRLRTEPNREPTSCSDSVSGSSGLCSSSRIVPISPSCSIMVVAKLLFWWAALKRPYVHPKSLGPLKRTRVLTRKQEVATTFSGFTGSDAG